MEQGMAGRRPLQCASRRTLADLAQATGASGGGRRACARNALLYWVSRRRSSIHFRGDGGHFFFDAAHKNRIYFNKVLRTNCLSAYPILIVF